MGCALAVAEVHAPSGHEDKREIEAVGGGNEPVVNFLDENAGVIQDETGLTHFAQVPQQTALHLHVVLDAHKRGNDQLIAYKKSVGEHIYARIF